MTASIRTLQANADRLAIAAQKASDAAYMTDCTRSIYSHTAANRALAAAQAAKEAAALVEAATAHMSFVEACFACYSDEQLLAKGYNVAKMRASLAERRVA